eukprot:RCo048059
MCRLSATVGWLTGATQTPVSSVAVFDRAYGMFAIAAQSTGRNGWRTSTCASVCLLNSLLCKCVCAVWPQVTFCAVPSLPCLSIPLFFCSRLPSPVCFFPSFLCSRGPLEADWTGKKLGMEAGIWLFAMGCGSFPRLGVFVARGVFSVEVWIQRFSSPPPSLVARFCIPDFLPPFLPPVLHTFFGSSRFAITPASC